MRFRDENTKHAKSLDVFMQASLTIMIIMLWRLQGELNSLLVKVSAAARRDALQLGDTGPSSGKENAETRLMKDQAAEDNAEQVHHRVP